MPLPLVSHLKSRIGAALGQMTPLRRDHGKPLARLAGARGKRSTQGSAKRVADEMEEWFRAGACDGFVVAPTYFPGMIEQFCRMVVPELQRRGLFRKEYAGKSLRENLLGKEMR